jgi:hypothetical protein
VEALLSNEYITDNLILFFYHAFGPSITYPMII